MKGRLALAGLVLFAVACNVPDSVAPPDGLTPNAAPAISPRGLVQETIIDHIGPRYTHAGPGPHPTTESDRYSLLSGGIHWPSGGTIEYVIAGTEPVAGANAAVVAGEDVWDALMSGITLGRNDATTQTNPCTDEPNSVTWVSIDGPGAIAGATSPCYELVTKEIVGFTIILDSDDPWAIGSVANFLDVANVAAHEFGHAVGLGHVSSPRDGCLSLYKYVIDGEIQKRTPGLGDKLGMAALYANSNTTAGSCGS